MWSVQGGDRDMTGTGKDIRQCSYGAVHSKSEPRESRAGHKKTRGYGAHCTNGQA